MQHRGTVFYFFYALTIDRVLRISQVLSVVNVSVLLADLQHLHPHDAILLPNGDMVVATWAPGRISYWKHLKDEPVECGSAPENSELFLG